jgi:hypothetical protein
MTPRLLILQLQKAGRALTSDEAELLMQATEGEVLDALLLSFGNAPDIHARLLERANTMRNARIN